MTDSETLQLGADNRRLDATAVAQGLTREVPGRDGVSVTVLPLAIYNPRFRRALQNGSLSDVRKVAAQNEAGEDVSEEETQRVFDLFYGSPELIVDVILADIEGIRNGNGNPVQYNRERGLQIMRDDGFADVRGFVVSLAMMQANFYEEEVQEDAGN